MADPITNWQIASWLWDRKDEIARKVADLIAWFRGKPDDDRGILIIGPGGTGKTTLARLLSGQFDWLTDAPWEYRESAGVESYTLADDPKTQLFVPPGQHHRRASGWADVEADIAAGKYHGVILLAAYGYHNLNQSYKRHPLHTGNKAAFLDAYLAAGLADELGILNHLATAIRFCQKKLWLFSVVTKQDLWWPSEAGVVEHYSTGPWREVIDRLTAAKDPWTFRQELLLASLVISNFDTPESERLRKNSEGYDQKAQMKTVRRLFEVLDALRQWEETA